VGLGRRLRPRHDGPDWTIASARSDGARQRLVVSKRIVAALKCPADRHASAAHTTRWLRHRRRPTVAHRLLWNRERRAQRRIKIASPEQLARDGWLRAGPSLLAVLSRRSSGLPERCSGTSIERTACLAGGSGAATEAVSGCSQCVVDAPASSRSARAHPGTRCPPMSRSTTRLTSASALRAEIGALQPILVDTRATDRTEPQRWPGRPTRTESRVAE
jgi:hypothetical protein